MKLSIAQKLLDSSVQLLLYLPTIVLQVTWQCKIYWDQNVPEDIKNQCQACLNRSLYLIYARLLECQSRRV